MSEQSSLKMLQSSLPMLFVAAMGERRRTVPPAACHSTFRVSARRRFGTGRCLFPAFQTLSNLALRQNCTKSDARGFETAPVGPDEAEDLMRPALDLQAPGTHFVCDFMSVPLPA
jgi:hypothetical protein